MDLALLTQCEKAALFGKAKAIFNIQHPNTRKGGHGWLRPALAEHPQRFPAWVKEQAGCGMSEREIYKHCRVWNIFTACVLDSPGPSGRKPLDQLRSRTPSG